MGILDWLGLRAKNDPTREWSRDASLVVELDLDKGTLCGDRLGEPPAVLAGLGKADDSRRAAEIGMLCYDRRGLLLSLEADPETPGRRVLESVVLIFASGAAGGQEFQGVVRQGGRRWELSSRTVEAEVLERLGPPHAEEREPDDTVFYYVFPSQRPPLQLEIGFTGGTLEDFSVTTPPSLTLPGAGGEGDDGVSVTEGS